MTVRRAADPSNVQHIWNAIRLANVQKEIPDVRSILKFFQDVGITSQPRVELYINQTLQDGLIVSLMKNGANINLTDSYRIPTEELTTPEDDGKDWYCIECHLGGDVTPCKLCHRVFHIECSRNASNKQAIFQSIKSLCSSSSKQSLQGTYNERLNDNENIIDISNDDFNEKLDMTDTMSTFDDIEKQLSNLENPTNNANTQRKISNRDVDNDYCYDVSICNVCNLSRAENNFDLEKGELNYLLGFILDRIRSWLPANLMHTMSPEQQYEWLTDKELSWRSTQLFYQHMDMIVMELKLQSQEYARLYEFLADVLTIQHNVALFHGIESQEYGAAELMLRDCVYDLKELIVCPDCYRHSNEKANNRWFCLPCRKPHRLVWAKQKGYPYWPAKVIKETDTNYDVRFFGGKYERSVLQKTLIKPIESSMKTLQIKRSGAFNRALEELRFHQKLLGNPNELAKLLTSSKAHTPHFLKSKKHYDMSNVEEFPQKNISIKKSFDLTQEVEGSTHKIVNRRMSGARSSKRKNSSLTSTDGSKRRSSSSTMVLPSEEQESFDVIPISDGEDDCEFSVRDNRYCFMKGNDSGFEQVSSSTEYITSTDDGFSSRDNIDNVMHELEQPYSDSVEKMRRKLEQTKDKNHLIKIGMDCMQIEIDRITNEHNEHLKKLFDAHNSQISETKKKQWCYNCEQDAIYHCCWNTAYCSPTCQQQHWQAEHKKVCRRKR